MSVLYIRAHSRFAVCRIARVHRRDGPAAEGRLVELSLDGCRLAVAQPRAFADGEQVTVTLDGWAPITGEVRWQGEDRIGLKLVQPFHTAELDSLLTLCRNGVDHAQRMTA